MSSSLLQISARQRSAKAHVLRWSEGKMAHMDKLQELIEAPLSGEQLAARYRALCENPCYANVPGKIEVDVWGRLLMSPASNYHSALQTRLSQRLAALGGEVFMEVSVLTTAGVRGVPGSSGRRGLDRLSAVQALRVLRQAGPAGALRIRRRPLSRLRLAT
jgi:hypothetical protein